jgi:hypothetical protein
VSVYAKRTEPPHVGLCFGSPTPIPLGLRFTGADRRTSEKGDALVTVEHRSHLIEECHRRAAEARRLADTPGVSLDERDDLLVVGCRPRCGWNLAWRDLRSHEGIVSGCEVNWLIDGLCGECLPAINFAHVDLA